jgi:hypothetical protein
MLCPKCKRLRATTSYEKVVFKKALGKDVEQIYDVAEKHCEECRNGYKGRIAIQEVLLIDDYLRDAINDENLQRDDLRKLVYTENVTTLLQDGLEKVLEGITSFNEIYKLIEIDDELDSHYSDDLLGNKMFTEELDKNTGNIITNKPVADPQVVQQATLTPPTQVSPTQPKTEEDLGKTEVLDLGAIN